MKKIMSVMVIVLISTLMINADVCIKQKINTPAMMGKAASSDIVQQWLGDGKMAMVGGQNGFVVDIVAKKMLMINNTDKTYVETSIPVDFSKLLPPEAAPMMEQMMKGMTVSVEKIGDTRKVAGIDTVSYKMTMGMMGMQIPMTMWVAEKLPFDWKKYQGVYNQMMQIMMKGGEHLAQEMAKIQGYPLASEMDMMGMKTTTETIEIITNATPPAGTYAAPAGYTKTDFMPMR